MQKNKNKNKHKVKKPGGPEARNPKKYVYPTKKGKAI